MPTLDELNDFKAALGEALGAAEASESYEANKKPNRAGEFPPDPGITIQEQADAIAEAVQAYLRALSVSVDDATNVVMKP